MNKIQFLSIFILTCYSLGAKAQTNYALSWGPILTNQKGGLELAENARSGHGAIHFNLSHFEESRHVGFAGGAALGRITTAFFYPLFLMCVEGSTGNLMVCKFEENVPGSATFNSVQLNAGPAVRIGQFFEFTVSPFLGINGRRQVFQGTIKLDPNFIYPATPADLYRLFDLGGQSRLTLRLNIGKHFSIHAQAHAGMTFTDMRKDQWRDARGYIMDAPAGSDWIALESSKLTRRFYGLSVGIGFK